MGRRASAPPGAHDQAARAAHASYGSIIVLAVLVAESDTAIDAAEAIASVIGAATVTAMAEFYAGYIGGTIRSHRHPSAAERSVELRNVAFGFLLAVAPVLFLILAAFDVLSLSSAFDAAIWTGVAVLGAQAFVANRIAGFTMIGSVAAGIGFTLLGSALVLLKVVV